MVPPRPYLGTLHGLRRVVHEEHPHSLYSTTDCILNYALLVSCQLEVGMQFFGDFTLEET